MAKQEEIIYRGGTPEQTWTNIPFDLRGTDVYVTYEQDDEVVIERSNDNLDIGYDTINFRLTQEETLALSEGKAKTQIKFKLQNGYVGYSTEKKVKVLDVQKDEVI